MKAVIQRVLKAGVSVNGGPEKRISKGLVILIGIGTKDTSETVKWGADKILNMRIFPNDAGKFDRSVTDINGELLVVSQFTLLGDVSKGRRPDFTEAERPERAIPLYEEFIEALKRSKLRVETGDFGASMSVDILNDGPVTIILDSSQ